MNQKNCNFSFSNNILAIRDKNDKEILSTILYRNIAEEFLIKLCEEKDLKKDYELNEKIFVNFNKNYISYDDKKYFITPDEEGRKDIFRVNFIQSIINIYMSDYRRDKYNEEYKKNFIYKFSHYIMFFKNDLLYYIYNNFQFGFKTYFHIFKSKDIFYKDETLFIFNDKKCLNSKRILSIDIDNNLVILDENYATFCERTQYNNKLLKFLKFYNCKIIDSKRHNNS